MGVLSGEYAPGRPERIEHPSRSKSRRFIFMHLGNTAFK
jgi:hypothetical protein